MNHVTQMTNLKLKVIFGKVGKSIIQPYLWKYIFFGNKKKIAIDTCRVMKPEMAEKFQFELAILTQPSAQKPLSMMGFDFQFIPVFSVNRNILYAGIDQS